MASNVYDPTRYFSTEDYAVFASMLVVSAAIGLYYGLTGGRKTHGEGAQEFLIGRGKMKTFPVALSMLAGFLSSITLIGQPAEVYLFGPQIWLFGLGCFIIIPIVSYIFIPFFRSLDATSAYEYFGRRFNRKFQLFASTIFSLQMILFLALVLYAPALALHQVTGINTEVVVIAMYIVCIFYTTVGGIKAVIWTDTFQVLVLYTAMVAILVKGTIDMGGVATVFKKNAQHQRSNFFEMVWIYAFGWALVSSLTAYAGMLIFAKYSDCDPLTNQQITTADQLFPYYVMDVLGTYKGFPGLFVAGIFSAGLSTVSTGVNSLAAIWFSEMEGSELKASLTPRQANITVKVLALFFGLLSFGVVFLVPYMGALVPVAISLNGFFSGALAGIFVIGIFAPVANSWGAFAGLISGVSVVGCLTIGVQISASAGLAVYDILPLSTTSCPLNNTISEIAKQPAMAPFRISFMWYSFLAFVITVVVGLFVSFVANCVGLGKKCEKWEKNEMGDRSGSDVRR